ncbi:MAG: hypothetical protein HXY46_09905 [Syntrophaceae bacterium]|nr:hypothetical protein [Syntrophaceae bacterium]
MKIISLCCSFYGILFFLLCFFTHAESKNPKQKPAKDHSQVRTMEVVRAGFGSGPDNIGIITPQEANPEGPMSFAVGKNREIYILDQINSRLQVFQGGKRVKTIPISIKDSVGFKDIALTPENKIVLLGRFYVKGHEKTSVYIIDSVGKNLNIISLEDGSLIPDSGEVTEIQIVEEGKFSGIWVGLEQRCVRVASLDGKSIERISVSGKLSLNGKRLLRAEKIGDATAVIYRSEEDSLSRWEPERTVYFETEIVHLLGLWDDRNGRIYLGAFLEDQSKTFNTIVVFNPEGKELGRVKLFVQKAPHEIYHPIRVFPDGLIFQMALDDRGIFVRRYDLTY